MITSQNWSGYKTNSKTSIAGIYAAQKPNHSLLHYNTLFKTQFRDIQLKLHTHTYRGKTHTYFSQKEPMNGTWVGTIGHFTAIFQQFWIE